MYTVLFYVGLVLALIFYTASVILYVKKDVGKLIGVVTGWNARKARRNMRNDKDDK